MPPFLRRVGIRGYKSLAHCDVRLQPLTVLVGRNAAGKSNFLDALAFLRDVMQVGVAEAVKRRGGWPAVVCRTAKTPTITFDIEAGFTCEPPHEHEGKTFRAIYTLELTGNESAAPTIAGERLEIVDEKGRLSGAILEAREGIVQRERSTPNGAQPLPLPHSRELLAALRPDHPLLAVIGTWPFLDLADRLRTMGFYNFNPESMRSVQKPLPGVMLEKDGRNLGSAIGALKETDPESFQRVREYLSTIAEEVEHFDVIRYGDYETVRFRLRSAPGAPVLEFDAAGMSDGTLRALAALTAAFQTPRPTGPSVVGIEEPEAALHPAATRTLVDALQEATQRTQVLLTTHSADLLADRDLDPAQILVVRNRNGQTHITPIDPASREIIRKELYTLADLQRMDQLDLDEADLQRQTQDGHAQRKG
jgi:predicted ATPase